MPAQEEVKLVISKENVNLKHASLAAEIHNPTIACTIVHNLREQLEISKSEGESK